MRLSFPFALAVSSSLACATASAADVFVDARNTGSQDGSAARPYRTVQAAVSAAKSGDRIKIATGTYQESISISDKGLAFEGGYPGATEATYSSGGTGDFSSSDPQVHPTEIRGSSGAPVVSVEGTVETVVEALVITGGGNGIVSKAYPELDGTLIVRRSLIENNGSPSVDGGGIFAESALVVEDSILRGNVGERGSGINARKASVRLVRTLVEGNVSHGDHGGGIYATGQIEILGCLVRNNRVGQGLGYGWGGGLIVFNQGTNATIADTEVRGNYAASKGSGVFVDDGAVATLRNVLVADNECGKEGGAVYVDGADGSLGSRATLINVTVAGHDCNNPGHGNALLLEQASTVTVESSIFWGNGAQDVTVDPGNSLTVRYTNAKDSLSGTGNTSEDPLFANPGAGDYRLKNQAGRWDPALGECVLDTETSPCVDSGDPAGAFDREPDPNGGRVDMGAYGNSLSAGCAANGGSGGWGGTGGAGGTGGTSGGTGGGTAGTGGQAGDGGESGAAGVAGTGSVGGSGGVAGSGGFFGQNGEDDDGSCACGAGPKPKAGGVFVTVLIAGIALGIRRRRR